jgi:hypothetical protein
MFQSIVEVDNLPSLNSLWCTINENAKFTNVFANPPGSLGIRLQSDQIGTYQIGTISMKMKHNDINISILIFKNKKIKISGGLGKIECDDNLETEMFVDFISQTLFMPCVSLIHNIEYLNIKSLMVNANVKTPFSFSLDKYLEFIDHIKCDYGDKIHLPKMFQSNPRGRVCAIKIKTGHGTFIFDHSCNIQAFSYRSLDKLRSDMKMIMTYINDFN